MHNAVFRDSPVSPLLCPLVKNQLLVTPCLNKLIVCDHHMFSVLIAVAIVWYGCMLFLGSMIVKFETTITSALQHFWSSHHCLLSPYRYFAGKEQNRRLET